MPVKITPIKGYTTVNEHNLKVAATLNFRGNYG
jgi:hypothetical protein